ncbi:trehalose-phosphatase-domain-containing protein [Flagelloscypha sp. PMI_526]|nr:trehalose-phosphatase-domain-containing protein [Flagelloscypha sp. PMI_526]
MTPYLPKDQLVQGYKDVASTGTRLFFFDYDGTLTPIVSKPEMATPTPLTLKTLEKLSSDPQNKIYIISGRDGVFLDAHLGHLPLLGFSAEHGAFLRNPGEKWQDFTTAMDMTWMVDAVKIFEDFTKATPGSQIERKKSSITWHYRNCEAELGLKQAAKCEELLRKDLAPGRPCEVLVGKMNLEVGPSTINKGEILKRIMRRYPRAEFVFCAGDDKTDEHMFRALSCDAGASAFMNGQANGHVHLTNGHVNGHAPLTNGQANGHAHFAPEIFTTLVGPSTKETLAKWHVEIPEELVDILVTLLK